MNAKKLSVYRKNCERARISFSLVCSPEDVTTIANLVSAMLKEMESGQHIYPEDLIPRIVEIVSRSYVERGIIDAQSVRITF